MQKPTQEMTQQMLSIGYLTTEAAASLANVAKNTVSGWAQNKTVESIRRGMYVFVSEKDVKKLLPTVAARKAKASIMHGGALVAVSENDQRKNLLSMLRDPIVREEMLRIVNEGIVRFTEVTTEPRKV